MHDFWELLHAKYKLYNAHNTSCFLFPISTNIYAVSVELLTLMQECVHIFKEQSLFVCIYKFKTNKTLGRFTLDYDWRTQ